MKDRITFLTGYVLSDRIRPFFDSVTNPTTEKPFDLTEPKGVITLILP
jgi:hypothetical protein